MSVRVSGLELAAAAVGTLVMACGGEVAKLVNFVIKRRDQGALFSPTRATLIALWSCVAFYYCLLFHLGSICKHEVMDTGQKDCKFSFTNFLFHRSLLSTNNSKTRVNFLYPR